MRHHIVLGIVTSAMAVAMATVAVGKRSDVFAQRMYAESFGWLSTHMNHEHPTHSRALVRIAKLPTISGGFADIDVR